MLDLQLSTSLVLCSLPLVLFFLLNSISNLLLTTKNPPPKSPSSVPKSYPLVGSSLALAANKHRRIQWTADILASASPSATFVLRRSLGLVNVFTAHPDNVRHILKTRFSIYQKGPHFRTTLSDFLGDGIFNVDAGSWKLQRQLSSHEFNTRSLRRFVEQVVDAELSDRLLPILAAAAAAGTVLDLQDLLQRFAFDNVCKIAFGHDPEYLSPSLPRERFAEAFEDATMLSGDRFSAIFPIVWKIKRFLDVGSERRLRIAIEEVTDFAKRVIREKKREIEGRSDSESLESTDLLSRFLISGHSDEKFVKDMVVSFVLAGRDTTSAALTWFFWLVHRSPRAEGRIVEEIGGQSEAPGLEEMREMAYAQAALCESMRLYPPVPTDTKEAAEDDVLPTGLAVRKGTRVTYHPYAMGRSEAIWGKDWAEFRPERWLQRAEGGDGGGTAEEERWRFVARDPYEYPVFQAGPRICLGKEMAFLQMKRVVAGVLRRFRVVPAAAEGVEPVFVSYLTSKMKGGFPVRIMERERG